MPVGTLDDCVVPVRNGICPAGSSPNGKPRTTCPASSSSRGQDVGEDHERRVDAWDRLNDDQKNFFDMKDGLPDALSEVEQELFGELSPADREVLSDGFGPNVDKCWTLRNVSAKKELTIRGQGDLEHGLELIRREI